MNGDDRKTRRGPVSSAVRPWARRSRGGSVRAISLVAVVLAGAVLLSATTAPAAATATERADTTFLVALQPDGDAEVHLRLAFDRSTEADRRALDRLRVNGTALAEEFGAELAAVADAADSRTGREMSVSDPTASVTTEGSTGYVTLSVRWSGLAAVEGDSLRLGAPFDDGFRPPGRFVVRAPEGYAVTAASPGPATESGREVAWEAGTSLSDFEATVAPADSGGGVPSQSMPGFGLIAGGFALAAALVVALRRRP